MDLGRIQLLVMGQAATMRERARMVDPPFHTTQIIEVCFDDDIKVLSARLPAGIAELALRRGGQRQIFYPRRRGSRSSHHPAHRVGIAHGLGHFLTDLATEDGERRCGFPWSPHVQFDWLAPVEDICDLFAGELLAPLGRMDQEAPTVLFPVGRDERHAFLDRCDQIASNYNVPADFIVWRMKCLQEYRRLQLSKRIRSVHETMLQPLPGLVLPSLRDEQRRPPRRAPVQAGVLRMVMDEIARAFARGDLAAAEEAKRGLEEIQRYRRYNRQSG